MSPCSFTNENEINLSVTLVSKSKHGVEWMPLMRKALLINFSLSCGANKYRNKVCADGVNFMFASMNYGVELLLIVLASFALLLFTREGLFESHSLLSYCAEWYFLSTAYGRARVMSGGSSADKWFTCSSHKSAGIILFAFINYTRYPVFGHTERVQHGSFPQLTSQVFMVA